MAIVHLEGMGFVGSVLARTLAELDRPFTWNDTEQPVTAWMASAGSIFPNAESYATWRQWATEKPWVECTELGAYWATATKRPYNFFNQTPGVFVNVPLFVGQTRELFKANRVQRCPDDGAQKIVAHGFDPRRLSFVQWGWAQRAKVQWPEDIVGYSKPLRPALVLRKGQARFGFLFPVHGEPDLWLCGTRWLKQLTAQPCDGVPGMVEEWKKRLEGFTFGQVQVTPVEEPRQGWRPWPGTTPGPWFQRYDDGSYGVRPLGSKGVALAPSLKREFTTLVEDL